MISASVMNSYCCRVTTIVYHVPQFTTRCSYIQVLATMLQLATYFCLINSYYALLVLAVATSTSSSYQCSLVELLRTAYIYSTYTTYMYHYLCTHITYQCWCVQVLLQTIFKIVLSDDLSRGSNNSNYQKSNKKCCRRRIN